MKESLHTYYTVAAARENAMSCYIQITLLNVRVNPIVGESFQVYIQVSQLFLVEHRKGRSQRNKQILQAIHVLLSAASSGNRWDSSPKSVLGFPLGEC